jgi:hypothetical protein
MKTIEELKVELKAKKGCAEGGLVLCTMQGGNLMVPTVIDWPDVDGWFQIVAGSVETRNLAFAQLETATTADEVEKCLGNIVDAINGIRNSMETLDREMRDSDAHDLKEVEEACTKYDLNYKALVADKLEP